MRELGGRAKIILVVSVFFATLISSILWTIYSDIVLRLLSEGRYIATISTILLGLISYFVFFWMNDGEGWDISLSGFSISKQGGHIGAYMAIILGLIAWLILFNLLFLMMGMMLFEMVGVGHTHIDRINLVTDLLGLFYGIILLALLLLLPYYLYETWSAEGNHEG